MAAGTKTYRHGADFAEPLAELDGVPDALRRIVKTLTSLGYKPQGSESREYLLNPGLQRLKKAVRTAAASAPVVVVYYTGHGLKPERSPYYLVISGTEPRQLGDTALEARQLVDLVLRRDAHGEVVPDEEQPQVLIILDCCFSGAGGLEALREAVQGIGNPKVWVLGQRQQRGVCAAGPVLPQRSARLCSIRRPTARRSSLGPRMAHQQGQHDSRQRRAAGPLVSAEW